MTVDGMVNTFFIWRVLAHEGLPIEKVHGQKECMWDHA